MICTRLEGGLGNQLFQYAAGKALAVLHNTELILDTKMLGNTSSRVTPRHFELDCFSVAGRMAYKGEIQLLPIVRYAPWIFNCMSSWKLRQERGQDFDPNFHLAPDRTYLWGYWQSHRYFADIADALFQELSATQPLSRRNEELSKEIAESNSVALHVRRGDYVSLSTAAKYHGALPLDYYIRALGSLQGLLDHPRFYVFSDDPAWCAEHLPLRPKETVFIAHNHGKNSWQDLVLMSLCHHHIIANSSFSWWGAWLADQRWGSANRLVFAPERWFVARSTNLKDRFPDKWKVISCNQQP